MRLYKFYADWCGPCRMMAPVAEKIANENGLELVPVDIDDNPDLANEAGVQSVPTLVLVENDEEVARVTGLSTKANLENALGLA